MSSSLSDVKQSRDCLRRVKANLVKDIEIRNDIGLDKFIAAVPENCVVEKLVVRDCRLPFLRASALSSALLRMPHLRKFKMTRCSSEDAYGPNSIDLSILAPALATNGSLAHLGFVECNIGDGGMQDIVSAFGDDDTVHRLALKYCRFGNDGVIALASLLEANSTLAELDFSGNHFGAEGISALARSLAKNKSLKSIECEYSPEIKEAFKRILYNDESIDSVIASNHTLKVIYPDNHELRLLIFHNRKGPTKAVQRKVMQLLNEQPKLVATTGAGEHLMPALMEQVGRDCRLHTMFELVQSVPGLFQNANHRPYRQCRKRSRPGQRYVDLAAGAWNIE